MMARRVFFSFHYENDVWRAFQIRNSWITKEKEAAGFVDSADFEKVKKDGDAAIRRWIDAQLNGTSVTVVLIGSETSNRAYIKYELEQSWKKGNGILGIHIHQCEDKDKKTCKKGDNSFGAIFTSSNDDKKYFFERFKTYEWVADSGYKNLGSWIETAAKEAGR